MSDVLPSIPKLDNTFGAWLLGTFVGLVLYGISLHQLYRYFRLYPTDTTFIRVLVIVTMALETSHAVFTMHASYSYLVTNYFNPQALLSESWSISLVPVFGGIVMAVTQTFFVRRIALIDRRHCVLAWIASMFLVAEFAFSAVSSIKSISGSSVQFLHLLKINQLMNTACFGATMAADILLTGSLLAALRRSRTRSPRTDTPWDVLSLYVVNTGLLTAISNFVSLILVATMPGNLIYGSFTIITTRLHANMLLSVLNSRKFNVVRGTEILGLEEASASYNIFARARRMAVVEQWNVPQVEEDRPRAINVKVTTETEGDKVHIDYHLDSQGTVEGDCEVGAKAAELVPNRRISP